MRMCFSNSPMLHKTPSRTTTHRSHRNPPRAAPRAAQESQTEMQILTQLNPVAQCFAVIGVAAFACIVAWCVLK